MRIQKEVKKKRLKLRLKMERIICRGQEASLSASKRLCKLLLLSAAPVVAGGTAALHLQILLR